MKTPYRERDYKYGEAMLELRKAIEVTQEELGRLLDVSRRSVAEWEAGCSYPRPERLKALIELAVQHQAFSTGSEAQEIRQLWKVAHQKVLLDEDWLSVLLAQQRSPQEQALLLQPRVVLEPVEETVTTAQVTEQERTDEKPTELRMPSDQSSQTNSLHPTDLEDAVACQSQEQNHEQLRETCPLPALPKRSFPQTLSTTNAHRLRRKLLMGILITLILLIIIGSVGTFFFLARNMTTPANKTSTDPAYPGYLSGKGTLAFSDPLSQESGSKWSSYGIDSAGNACQFTGGAYHVSERKPHAFNWCPTQEMFSNFAFEVQLTITQGDCGGMLLRYDYGHFYYFAICEDGTYRVTKYVDYIGSHAEILVDSSSSAIYTGQGHENKIAVVASGSTMTFYVNLQRIDQVQEGSYTSGKIGLTASQYYDNGHATDVAYSNARLWTL